MFALIHLACAAAMLGMGPDAPKNLDLIASMPSGTESVLVVRLPEVSGEAGPMAFISDWFRPEKRHESAAAKGKASEQELREAALAAADKAHPVVGAIGGSAFAMPEGIGGGRFTERMIVSTKDSLDGLKKQLAEGKGIGGLVGSEDAAGGGGTKIYRGRQTLRMDERDDDAEKAGKPSARDWYAAVPDEHTVVMGEKKADVEQMIKAVRSKDHEVPGQWKAAAKDLDIEAPIVILRKFDPTNTKDATSPVNPKLPPDRRADIDSAGMIVPKATQRLLKVHVVSKDPAAARKALDAELFRGFTWKQSEAADGFKADLLFDEKNQAAPLQVLMFFGVNVAI